MPPVPLRVALACLALFGSACSRPATAIVVVVDTDMTVPSELASVHVEVGGAACSDASCTHDFPLASATDVPFSFTITPAGGSGPLALVVRGRDPASTDRVVRSVSTRFVEGHTVLLRVRLERACIDATACSASMTCVGGICASDLVDAASLHDVVPGTELSFDAGTTDADRDALVDVDADAAREVDAYVDHDGNVDAGPLPATCADVPTTSPSGTFLIDPDGAGGEAPFVAYCETSADGGHWTLIAKVDPSTTAFAFSNGAWDGDASSAFGTPDLTVGNALLPSYWSLVASDLRFVMAPVGAPTQTRTLLAHLHAGATTLHSAMSAGTPVTMDVTQGDWVTLIGASHALGVSTCEATGIPAELPTGAPLVHVRIGYVWSDTAGCTSIGFWAGLGAEGMGCRDPVMAPSGGGRVCGTGAQRESLPRAAWLFAR